MKTAPQPTSNLPIGLFSASGETEFDPFSPSTGIPLPVGTYVLRCAPLRGFYLERQQDIPFPARIYGKCHAPRILESYRARAADGDSTGVWLNGEKGSGKTMLAAILSEQMRKNFGLPTILIQTAFKGPEFNSFIEHLGAACVIFDEFEKVYNDSDDQDALLTVFAGAVVAKHLYVLTTNAAHHVADAMRNRPTRMRYFIDSRGVAEDMVREFVAENLKDQSAAKDLIAALRQIPECNFDVMMCAVEEHNRFSGSVEEILGLMNISRTIGRKWKITYRGKYGGKDIVGKGDWAGDLEDVMSSGENEDFMNEGVSGHAQFVVHFTDSDGDREVAHIMVPRQPVKYENDGSIRFACAEGEMSFTGVSGFSSWHQKF